MAALDAHRTTLKFVDPESFMEQELWWHLAKTFVAPPPSTVAELEPIKQRMRTDRSYALTILRDVAKCSYSWQMTQYLSQELKDDRDIFLAAISQPEGWKCLKFASETVRDDAVVCHEAVSRNVAALEYIANRFRRDGRILSLWLSMAVQKANQRLENKFDKHWNKASRPVAPRKRVRVQESESVSTERVVPIAALCVQSGSRCILVSMGSYDPESRKAVGEIKYPGVKVKPGESPYDAAARLCKSRLTPLSEFIQVETASFDAKEEEDISKRTGLPSRYLRTIFRAHMSPLVPWAEYMRFIPSRSSQNMKLTSKHSNLARRFLRAHPRSPPLCPDLFALKQDLGSPDITIYAWIPAWEFEYLRYTSQGEALVDHWVQHGDFSVLHTDGSAPRCYSPVTERPRVVRPTPASRSAAVSAQRIAQIAKTLTSRRENTKRTYNRVSVLNPDQH